jgi:3'(2'), 5'-bisphosphate nucleotidase
VSDMTGAPLDFSTGRQLTRNQGVIVTNGALHDAVIAAIAHVTAGTA